MSHYFDTLNQILPENLIVMAIFWLIKFKFCINNYFLNNLEIKVINLVL
jgi:hypothetical protein